jgi:hypothetical protein
MHPPAHVSTAPSDPHKNCPLTQLGRPAPPPLPPSPNQVPIKFTIYLTAKRSLQPSLGENPPWPKPSFCTSKARLLAMKDATEALQALVAGVH